jgi:hypothetical protein
MCNFKNIEPISEGVRGARGAVTFTASLTVQLCSLINHSTLTADARAHAITSLASSTQSREMALLVSKAMSYTDFFTALFSRGRLLSAICIIS